MSRKGLSGMGNTGASKAMAMSESELRGYIKRNNLTRAYNMTINSMNNHSHSNQMTAMRRAVADKIDRNIQRGRKTVK